MDITCKICNKEFKYNSDLLRHINRKNPCNKFNINLECKICNVRFNCNNEQERHEKTNKHIKNLKMKDNSDPNVNIDLTNQFKKYNISITNKKLLEISEYIYIATNSLQDGINIYKIGRTSNLNSRLVSYNTGQIVPYYYCSYYKCSNAASLEKRIFSILSSFKVKNEMYQIKFEILDDIIKTICNNDLEVVNKINDHINSLTIN